MVLLLKTSDSEVREAVVLLPQKAVLLWSEVARNPISEPTNTNISKKGFS